LERLFAAQDNRSQNFGLAEFSVIYAVAHVLLVLEIQPPRASGGIDWLAAWPHSDVIDHPLFFPFVGDAKDTLSIF
jgi:hypothetical protein